MRDNVVPPGILKVIDGESSKVVDVSKTHYPDDSYREIILRNYLFVKPRCKIHTIECDNKIYSLGDVVACSLEVRIETFEWENPIGWRIIFHTYAEDWGYLKNFKQVDPPYKTGDGRKNLWISSKMLDLVNEIDSLKKCLSGLINHPNLGDEWFEGWDDGDDMVDGAEIRQSAALRKLIDGAMVVLKIK